jgi:hypothetical protein
MDGRCSLAGVCPAPGTCTECPERPVPPNVALRSVADFTARTAASTEGIAAEKLSVIAVGLELAALSCDELLASA